MAAVEETLRAQLDELKLARQSSEARFRNVINRGADGILIVDESGRILFVNPAAEKLFGRKADSLLGETFGYPVLKGEKTELEILSGAKQGTAVEMRVTETEWEQTPAYLATLRDITERKQAELRLRESEARLRSTLDAMLEGCQIIDRDWRYAYVNDVLATQSRRNKEELLGHTMMEIYPGIENTDIFIHLRECMENREPHHMESEFALPKGRSHWFELRIEPVPEGILVLSLDIAEKKEAEEQLLRRTRELEDANSELQQFAYVASHDLREPLRMVTSFAQSLEKRYKDKLDNTANEYIDFMVDGAARMQNLIDDLLLYSRVGTRGVAFEPVDMEKVLQDVLGDLRITIEESKAKVTHDPLPAIEADPTQMMQVMQNLVTNAIKFRRDEEAPAVHVSARREDSEWVFSVKDNGIGIDQELFGRLFVLFSRLHVQGKYPGTGIGLAVVKRIVQRHGGRVWVESWPGKGSIFYFTMLSTAMRDEHGKR
jgi:PAS domain S-box-containing protein